MPIEAVKIPQNVYIEDRIIGPLSLRQIIIIAFGAGISYIIFASLQKSMGGTVPIVLGVMAWIPAGIAAIFAMVKVNDLSITRILFLLLEKTQKPSERMWANRTGISINFRTNPKPVNEEKEKKLQAAANAAAHDSQNQIAELSTAIDRMWAPAGSKQTVTPTAFVQDDTPVAATQEQPEITDPTFVLPSTDKAQASPDGTPSLSDLSVFRDIFPPPSHGSAA